jgi:glycine/D-amino acid oxidase-like deaminating enzyme
MSHYDYLIVGQGLAGTLLGYELQRAGRSVHWIDAPGQTSASSVAAGIINPITGRRYVKSWMVEELIPIARATYRELEADLGISVYHERPLWRTLFNRGEENDWMARTGEATYAGYMDEPQREAGPFTPLIEPAFAYGRVRQTAQVDIGRLVAAFTERILGQNRLRRALFDYEAIHVDSSGVRYGELSADRLVFCEGWRARYNPFFNYLPFGGNKGQVLIVRIPGVMETAMLKHRVFLVPLGEERYWIGSTSENTFANDAPTATSRAYLEDRLRELLTVPFEVIDHRAAVRPTVRDRRPFLGVHPELPRLALFNGLGTKGASLGPYWARAFAQYLDDPTAAELPASVAITRFAK